MSSTQKDKTLVLDIASFTKEEVISAALNTAVDLSLPIAIWRMPHQSEIHLVLSIDDAKKINSIDLDELKTGFLIAPFQFGKLPAHFIEDDFHLSLDFDEVINNPSSVENEGNDKLDQIKITFETYLTRNIKAKHYHLNPKNTDQAPIDYRHLIEKSVTAIIDRQFDKVVPARSKNIEIPDDFSPVDLLIDLCTSYPNAFVSFVSIPKIGTWIGATPEILIEKADNTFKTIALAGTQNVDPLKPISDTSWTEKEIEEQAMVSRYIINCFKKIRLREYEEVGPKTVQAGNLLHLKTTYAVNTIDTNFDELATVMLNLLHPTSAVAGMPKESAMDFLNQFEKLNREFFSGFLGPVNLENSTNLFVNLRCMQLLDNQARLYAGAGVTLDSDPEKEYQETEMKFKTMLDVVNRQL